ncbi:phospholipid carrier-dependent glycosyltransferase [Ketobacter sp. MCCC 1A13808]|uniref:glycosyltransferase family 39 protein n=1 Tax=Ketobacter sp. MCCC 1A13808 TaxID=2602738 RepID=UPI0012EC82EA|nr:glycosyltransferase family 39 protein [Ketobacter sp. MCCC 1A13808]MVF11150.1 phospholipid carrier-dependent glycosyltransferase [Ketobacter sp. MCCC 1A13808]
MKLIWVHIKSSISEVRQSPLLWVLLGVLFIGLVLRVWGISFGLPNLYHEDEGFEVNRALQLASGSFDFTRIGKGGYFYVLFADFGLLFVFLKLVGMVESAKDFALLFIRDPSYFYLMGRFTTAVIGTLSLFLMYKVGSKVFSRLAGVIAAVLLCVNLLHAQLSHYITVDIPLTCLCLASFIFILRVLEDNKISNYLWAACFIALASMTKMPGFILVFPFFVAHIVRQKSESRNILIAAFDKKWILACILLALVYILGNPGILIYFKSVVLGVFQIYKSQIASSDSSDIGGLNESGEALSPLTFYIDAIFSSMGLVVFVIALVGMLVALLKPKIEAILLLLFGGVFFLALALSADPVLMFPRYVLPIIPVIVLFAAQFIVIVSELLSKHVHLDYSVLSIVFVALLAIGGVRGVIEENMRFSIQDSRTVSRNWIEENVPENATILVEGFTAQSFRGSTPILNSRENIQLAIQHFEETNQPGKAKYFRLELEANTGKRYDLELYNNTNLTDLAGYLSKGVEYIVLRPDYLTKSPKYMETGPQFVESIRNNSTLELVKTFIGESSGGAGPYIELYKVKSIN